MVAAGYSLENKAGSNIGGNLNYFGGQALLAGTIQHNVRGAVGALEVAGKVNGNMNTLVGNQPIQPPPFVTLPLNTPKVQPGLTLTPTAQIRGSLNYRSASPAKINPDAKVTGRVTHEEMLEDEHPRTLASWLLFQAQRWVALFLVGLLLLQFVPGWTQNLSAAVQSRPLPALGWGIVTVLVVMLGAIAISLVTVLLLILSGLILPTLALPILGAGSLAWLTLLIGFGVIASFVPQIVISLLGGEWMIAQSRPVRPVRNGVALGVGTLVFILLTAIPIVGGILNAVVIFLGLGAIWMGWRHLGGRGDITQERPLATV